jgi:hypothetical protein
MRQEFNWWKAEGKATALLAHARKIEKKKRYNLFLLKYKEGGTRYETYEYSRQSEERWQYRTSD